VPLLLRDIGDSMPDPMTILTVIVINPHGKISTARQVVPRGTKTLKNQGSTVTYPFDFTPVNERGLDQTLQTGIYTVLWELQDGAQVACEGFVGQHDQSGPNVN
jgi:hypothetical protein